MPESASPSKPERKTYSLRVRFTEAERRRLRKHARDRGLTVTELVRGLLRQKGVIQ